MKCNSRILFILLLIVMIFSITAVSAAENHTQVKNIADHESVNNMEILGISSNDNIISASDNGKFSDLKNKVDAARPGSVLTLENDYKFTDNFISTGITISKSLTIDGNGYTIDALNKGRIFTVTSGSVTIKNLTIKNANGNENGGAILWSGGTGCVSNCTFLDCKSNQNGSTIFWENAYGFVVDSKFINCKSPNNCAGAIYWNGVNGTVDNCSFIKCSSKFGGAIYWGSYNGSLMNSHFEDCYSTSYGGAVDWVGSNGFIDNCTFKKCYSADYGGAVYYQSLNAEIFNCKFLNCYSKSSSAGAVFLKEKGGTLKNCSFISCSSTSGGGAIAWNANNGNVSDCTFVKCFSDYTNGGNGGAIYWYNATDGFVKNSTFINCSALNKGGAIFWASNSARGNVINCSFVKCHTKIDGGAIYWSATRGSVSDSRFEECFTGWFGNGGGGIYWYATSGSVNNCTFLKCTSEYNGGGIYWNSRDGKLQNSTFDSCKVDNNGGGLYWASNNGFTYGCNFTNCSSNNAGGIYWTGGTGSAFNITMVNCSAKTNGGGLYWSGSSGSVRKSDFEGCSADFGGAAYWMGKNGNVTDSIFMICSAKYGGAIHIYNTNVDVNNSYFENNSAYHSGAINIRASDVVVDNSNFTDNHVSHGGGAIGNYGEYPDKVNAVIRGSKFDNNRANNYGGALSLEYVLVDNSLFNDNSAVFGGAIYSISPEIINSTFNGCKALELGNDVFAINKSTIVNSNVLSENLYENNLTDSIIMVESGKITYNGYDYDVFAAESNIISPNGRGNDLYIADSSLKLLRNVVDSSDCSEYLKLILYNYSNNQLSRSEAVAMIRNGVYGNSPVPSEKAPVFEFVGNSVIVYDYISFITPSSNTNYYSVKKTNYILNQSITKVALNKTAFVGDIVEFSINFTNGNNFTLPDVFVKEVFNENEFEYLSFKSNDNWTYNSTSKIFTLSSLNSHNTSNLVLSFKVKTNATLNNTVYGGFKGSITCNNTTSIKTFNPVLNVEKSCLTPNVFLTQTAKFNITVKNNGDIDLHDIVLTEDNSKDLLFEGFYDYGLWDYSLINKKHTWKLLNPLAPGHASSLLVYFNTNASGRLVNNVSVESSQTKGKFTAQDSVDVIRPEIKVEKIAVNPDVVLSDSAVFEIIVNNTSPVDLTGVSVCEDSYDGLLYDSFMASDKWIHSVIAGKHVWTFKENLVPGGVISFFTVFNTTSNGTFVNNVVASSDISSSSKANATVNVLMPKFSVEKVASTPSVVLGNQARFEIIVNNTGKVDLSDVRVYEDSFDGLVYDSYSGSNRWTCQIINSKPVWTFNDVLPAGEVVLLTVYFNTTKAGTFSNTAVVKSGKADDVSSACEVNVVKPEIKVEKICLTPNVVLGDQAKFEIIVNNTGASNLSDITVYEDSFDGLVYDSYRASNRWTYKIINSRPVWTFNEVLPAGEWVSLFVNFNTTAEGTFTNHVKTKSNLADANGSDDVVVLKPEIGVEKITLTPNVILGDLASFEIVIHNNGRTDLTNVTVMELPDASLIYDSYLDNDLFTHRFVNGVHIWSLDKLSRGSFAGFIVYYKTTKLGIISNSVLVESNEISNKSGSNTTNVLLPSFTVEKVCLTLNVLAGNQTAFEIVIHNTGDVPLHDVYIIEDYYDGLIYDSALDDKLWTHELDGGKHKWVLNTPLQSNEFIDLFVKFNTTVSGNFTNFAIASSSETGSRLVNATVQVFDVMPEPPVTNSSNETSFDLFKTVITEEILVNGQVTFQVVIHNTGKNDLKEVILTELPPEGLIYDSFADYIDLWNYNGDLTWSANRNIRPDEYVGFFITFNTTGEGRFANRIEVKANNSNTTDANASFDVLKPDFTVEKILVSEDIVSKGSQVAFEIVIHNSGKTSLNNLTVKEYSFDGLIYNHFVDYLNIWNLNDDLSWTMNTTLLPGEFVGFFIVFNTTDTGNFTNIVVANSSECYNRYSNASVSVLNGDFTIDMVCLNPLIILGNQVTFEITIQNTGKIPINVLNLSEFDFEGLVFDHFNDYLGHWIYNGDLIWTLNETLVSRELTSLFVVFNTTDVGNFTNIVFAEIPQEDTNELLGADEGNGKFAEAKVEVIRPEYVIEKIAINKTVSVGQQVLFEIVVKNTGRVALDDIVISESEIDGLVFNHFIDYMNVWINDGMNWRLNTSLLSGELMSLFVVYNTTQAGNFTNVISSGNLTSNAIVEVLRLEYSIEKIAINKTVTLGSQVLFEILVKNTGKVSVDDIVISESEIEGLVFDHFIDYMNVWINDGMTWRLNTALHSGEVRSLYLAYNTTKAGNITNIITSGNLTSNATVEVNDNVKPVTNPNIAVTAEIVENPIYIGNTTLVKITVTNTGDVDLDNVFVDLMLNSGLIYDSMLGNWTYNNNRFNLNTVLRVGESSTFYVSVKALTAGNLSSIAYAGFNNTQITNSTFGIEVLNKTAPANKTDNNKTDNITDNTQAKVVKGAVGNNSTGNPLVLILFALLALVSVNVRRKK